MQLGDLTRHGNPALAEIFRQIAQCPFQPVRRLIDDTGARLGLEHLQTLLSGLAVRGQESLKAPFSARQTALCQRTHRRTRTRHRNDLNAVLMTQRREILSRIADRRHTGIGHERTGLTLLNAPDNLRSALLAVVLMIAHHRLGDLQIVQQLTAHPGVLRRDKVALAENAHRAVGQILQIADRRADQI